MNLESIPCEMLSLYKLHLNHIFWFKWPVIVFWGEEPKTLVLQTKLSWILSGQVFNTSGSRYHLVCVHICFRFGNLVHSFTIKIDSRLFIGFVFQWPKWQEAVHARDQAGPKQGQALGVSPETIGWNTTSVGHEQGCQEDLYNLQGLAKNIHARHLV